MTNKQEEIREGIGTWLAFFKEGKQGLTVDDGVKWILGYLHSQGVVIKVDMELPKAPIPCPEEIPNDTYFYRGYERAKEDMANLVAAEPLIEAKV